ncbi:unnamed protein product [Rotaria sp. Silwood2]|nr:unnamed protein product [Rotaria sp. Silwood2]
MFINIGIGLISAAFGGLMKFLLIEDSSQRMQAATAIACIGFIIGIFISTIVTTILTSCARTIFVCFSLNPAALGVACPDHLQTLTKAWREFHPLEFADSGYRDQLVEQAP